MYMQINKIRYIHVYSSLQLSVSHAVLMVVNVYDLMCVDVVLDGLDHVVTGVRYNCIIWCMYANICVCVCVCVFVHMHVSHVYTHYMCVLFVLYIEVCVYIYLLYGYGRIKG